jgi:hypothetical protein
MDIISWKKKNKKKKRYKLQQSFSWLETNRKLIATLLNAKCVTALGRVAQ